MIDNRTGKSFELPITHSTIKASDLGKIKGDGFEGLRSYDPAYFNTAAVTSRISFIDGDKGILNYRGYPIEQLAEKSSFLEVSYLLIYGSLPDKKQLVRSRRVPARAHFSFLRVFFFLFLFLSLSLPFCRVMHRITLAVG